MYLLTKNIFRIVIDSLLWVPKITFISIARTTNVTIYLNTTKTNIKSYVGR
jgi:hypothetical protein